MIFKPYINKTSSSRTLDSKSKYLKENNKAQHNQQGSETTNPIKNQCVQAHVALPPKFQNLTAKFFSCYSFSSSSNYSTISKFRLSFHNCSVLSNQAIRLKPKQKTHMYITSNISSASLFKLSSNESIRLFFALKIGSGYLITSRGPLNCKSAAVPK